MDGYCVWVRFWAGFISDFPIEQFADLADEDLRPALEKKASAHVSKHRAAILKAARQKKLGWLKATSFWK